MDISIFTTVENAVVAAFAALSTPVTAVPWDTVDLPGPLPIVTMTFLSPDVGYESDQTYGIGELEYLLRYYTDAGGGTKAADALVKQGVVNVFTALAHDPTLGGQVIDSRLGKGKLFEGLTQHGPEMFMEYPIRFEPFTNRG